MTVSIQIFWVFFKIALMSFGGFWTTYPEIERITVYEYQWITQEQFIQSVAIGQFVPGPNTAMCPLIGYWVNGWSGFIAAFLGVYSAPLLVMITFLAIYRRYRSHNFVKRCESALRPMILGLISASIFSLIWNVLGSGAVPPLLKLLGIGSIITGAFFNFRQKIGVMSLAFLMGALWLTLNLIVVPH